MILQRIGPRSHLRSLGHIDLNLGHSISSKTTEILLQILFKTHAFLSMAMCVARGKTRRHMGHNHARLKAMERVVSPRRVSTRKHQANEKEKDNEGVAT